MLLVSKLGQSGSRHNEGGQQHSDHLPFSDAYSNNRFRDLPVHLYTHKNSLDCALMQNNYQVVDALSSVFASADNI